MDEEAPRPPLWLNLGLVLIALSSYLAYSTCQRAEGPERGALEGGVAGQK